MAVSFSLSPSAASVSSRIRLTYAPESRRVLLAFGTPSVCRSCMLSPAKELHVVQRAMQHQCWVQCSSEATDNEIACIPFHIRIHTLLTYPAVINSMLSSCWFQATKADVVFFGDLDMLVDTEYSEFRAGIWPLRRVFAVPAFGPLLVGCVNLKHKEWLARSQQGSSTHMWFHLYIHPLYQSL